MYVLGTWDGAKWGQRFYSPSVNEQSLNPITTQENEKKLAQMVHNLSGGWVREINCVDVLYTDYLQSTDLIVYYGAAEDVLEEYGKAAEFLEAAARDYFKHYSNS